MDQEIVRLIGDLGTKEDAVRKAALDRLMELTNEKVDWIYGCLEDICGKFSSENSYQRCIAAMLTANLAKSDSEGKLKEAIVLFTAQMDDVKFITARLTLQAAGKFGTASEEYAKVIAAALINTIKSNRHLSSHGNLIRLDAVTSLKEILNKYPGATDLSEAGAAITAQCDAKEAMKLMGILNA